MKTNHILIVAIFIVLSLSANGQTDQAPHEFRKLIPKEKINIGFIQSFQPQGPSSGFILQYLVSPAFEIFADGGYSRFSESNFHSNDRFIAPGHWYGLGGKIKLRLHPDREKLLVKPRITTTIAFSHGVSNIITHNKFTGYAFDDYVHLSRYPNYRSNLIQSGLGMEWRFKNNIVIHTGILLNAAIAQYNYDSDYSSPVSQYYGSFPIIYHPKTLGQDVSFEYSISIPLWKKLRISSKK